MGRFKFSRAQRLLSKEDYHQIYQTGMRQIGKNLMVCYRVSLKPRLGITISRKWGKAHDRNRFKRVVREAYRQSCIELTCDLELNVHPRSGYQTLTKEEVSLELKTIIKKIRDKRVCPPSRCSQISQ